MSTLLDSRQVPCNSQICSQAQTAASINQTAAYAGSRDVAASSGCRAASPVTVSLVESAAWIAILACPYVVKFYPSHEAGIVLLPEKFKTRARSDSRVCCRDRWRDNGRKAAREERGLNQNLSMHHWVGLSDSVEVEICATERMLRWEE